MLYSDHGHSVQRDSSALERVESVKSSHFHPTVQVPSGSVESTLGRPLPPSPGHHSANEHAYGANDCGSLQPPSSPR